jgi:hypothetical protein
MSYPGLSTTYRQPVLIGVGSGVSSQSTFLSTTNLQIISGEALDCNSLESGRKMNAAPCASATTPSLAGVSMGTACTDLTPVPLPRAALGVIKN